MAIEWKDAFLSKLFEVELEAFYEVFVVVLQFSLILLPASLSTGQGQWCLMTTETIV